MLIGGQFGGEFKWHMVEISGLENAVALRADALDWNMGKWPTLYTDDECVCSDRCVWTIGLPAAHLECYTLIEECCCILNDSIEKIFRTRVHLIASSCFGFEESSWWRLRSDFFFSFSVSTFFSRSPFVCNISWQKNMRNLLLYFAPFSLSKFLFPIRFGAAMWKREMSSCYGDRLYIRDRSISTYSIIQRGPVPGVATNFITLDTPYMDESIYNP